MRHAIAHLPAGCGAQIVHRDTRPHGCPLGATATALRAPLSRAQKRKAKAKPLPTLDSLAGALTAVEAAASVGKASKAKQQADKGRGSSVKRLKARRAIA
jgi:hypothetical protein